MKIFVLGYTGMLGRYVYTYFKSKGYTNIIGLSRKNIDASDAQRDRINAVLYTDNAIIINCIGVINSRSDVGKLDFISVNSVFPYLLSDICSKTDSKLIHITTDCVFDGIDGNYDEKHIHNAKDIYGVTKSLGEPENATVIRTSIIGEELNNSRSLLEWVKSNKGKEVLGYTNHVWNGITCLQFAKVCEDIIDNKLFWKGVKHVYSPESLTKYELVTLISKIYNLNVSVNPHKTETACDRTLTSIRNEIVIDIPKLETQLIEMREFNNIGGY